jgi:hypothetical protein
MLSSGPASKLPLQGKSNTSKSSRKAQKKVAIDTEIAEQSWQTDSEPPKYELVEFEGPSDKQNPKNWSVWTKIRVTGIVIWLSLNVYVLFNLTCMLALT